MSGPGFNASSLPPEDFHPLAADGRYGIVTARWNFAVTNHLREGAVKVLSDHGVASENLRQYWVPGSFELPLGAQMLIEERQVDAIICIGCLVRGETPHFEYISQPVSHHIAALNVKYNLPVVFGVLTVNDQDQAEARAWGEQGNKGEEFALTALRMVSLRFEVKGIPSSSDLL